MHIGATIGLMLAKQILNQLSIKGEDAQKVTEAQSILQQAAEANERLEKEVERLTARVVELEKEKETA